MDRRARELARSDRPDSAHGVGDTIPGFELPDASGGTISSRDLERDAPFVLTFFRGHW